MTTLLILLVTIPLLGAAVALAGRTLLTEVVTVALGLASFGMALALIPAAAHGEIQIGFLRADAISVVFLLGTTFLYAATAVYSIGYLRTDPEHQHEMRSYGRRFYVGINLFSWAMMCAPLMNGLALLWVAVEVTTVVSALLVALDRTDAAAEASWKYVLLASAGLGLALLATIVMYYAGSTALGHSFDLGLDPLIHAGPALPPTAVRLAFILSVVGFGTKVGLFPVHTWLPDGHSEAPTPVSALLSGSLLAVSFYAILRYYQIATRALGKGFPDTVMLVFGVLSLLLAALYVIEQRNVKRLLAYSSVEHMGILAIGVGFGAPLAMSGVLLHVLAHAAAKGNAFFGAGVLVRKYGTKDIASIRSGLDLLPWTAPLFLFGILALSSIPPFGLFRSEFQIVAGGLAAGGDGFAVAMVVLVTLAFAGLSVATTRMLYSSDDAALGKAPGAARGVRGEPSAWMVAPMVAAMLFLLLLGLHPPAPLTDLLTHGAALLGGAG